MKKLVGLLITVLVAALCIGALADVAIDDTNFPDENFQAYVKKNFDSDGDGILSNAEISGVTRIMCDSSNIASIKGVEFFSSLTVLWCADNQLKSLDVSKNTALDYLRCGNNQLTNLDVSKNAALRQLFCYGNQLTSLDISKNAALTYLSCGNNQMANLDISKNTALRVLYCDGNQLASLDISKNTALEMVYCNSNQLSNLDVSNCSALSELVRSTKREHNEEQGYDFHTLQYGTERRERYEMNIDPNVIIIAGDFSSKPTVTPEPTSKATVNNCIYELNREKKTATFISPADKTAPSLTIPATIKVEKKNYKVVAIADSACKGMNSLKTLVIGKNVKNIGNRAFYNCKGLKSITINATGLTKESIGKEAFKKVPKTVTVKCSKKKLEEYKSLLIKAGINKKAKFTK